jgi:hypothetical protein
LHTSEACGIEDDSLQHFSALAKAHDLRFAGGDLWRPDGAIRIEANAVRADFGRPDPPV